MFQVCNNNPYEYIQIDSTKFHSGLFIYKLPYGIDSVYIISSSKGTIGVITNESYSPQVWYNDPIYLTKQTTFENINRKKI